MTVPPEVSVVAIVLAGGESRRFGSDKLAADLAGEALLDHALDGLPAGATIVVVGPERPTRHTVTFVREDPPGGGPAAGLVAGLTWTLDPKQTRQQTDVLVTLPGDAPDGGRAAAELARAIVTHRAESVVAVDGDGQDQVLQLALTADAARQLIALAGPEAGRGQSVRRLIMALEPQPLRHLLPDNLVRDIDTTADLAAHEVAAKIELRNQDLA